MKKTTYPSLDGLRAFAALGIILVHTRENGGYLLPAVQLTAAVYCLVDVVFLFMAISAFGLCCGYYEQFHCGTMDFNAFYKKRFWRILPFFALVNGLDLLVHPSLDAVYEVFANLTLCFGLFPNSIEVIGVGWFLGVVFAFYFLFPFFCVLIRTKRRAWISFGVALAMNTVGIRHFGLDRHNIVYCMCYFLAGGLVYLYREELTGSKRVPVIAALIASLLCYCFRQTTLTRLMVTSSLLALAVLCPEASLLSNGFTHFFSGISMEVYLSHMIFYRVLERAHLLYLGGNGLIGWLLAAGLITIGTAAFSAAARKALDFCKAGACKRIL